MAQKLLACRERDSFERACDREESSVMFRIIALFGLALGLAGAASAQVINGEGTYEGSTLHQPPAPEAVAPEKPGGDRGSNKADDASRDGRDQR